ncbi:MAG: DegT/DnrJ/EryC1/StrS family aminotransferase [Acidobacteria bacterium]|nr:DegT/DnrJ/EryC1/StrS family aminotransferase [Acidobacteriota bacterium]MBI3655684.1 DegT/DnrJ/EryC1/StrS family aminotransferase [Acidobacteriota bacterium]
MIPIMRPELPKYELMEAQIREIFTTGLITSGKYVKHFEEKSAKYLGVAHTVTAPSATAGLTVVLSTLPEGSEVVMPAYTFSATYEVAKWNNLNPVLVDCDDSCNIDTDLIESAITERTSAIVAVHMYGTPPNIDRLEQIARKNNLRLFFDAAHAFGSMYKGKHTGGFGDAEVFSLGPTKTMPVGEGGLIATNHAGLAERFRLSCTHGHGPDSLDCEVKGINGRLQEINGIVGIHLLDTLDSCIERRIEIALRYKKILGKLPGISFPRVPDYVRTTYKDFSIFVDKEKFGMDREELYDWLKKEGIQTKRYFFPPIHKLTVAQEAYKNLHLPKTEKLSYNVLSLPIFTQMTSENFDSVCAAVEKAYNSRH